MTDLNTQVRGHYARAGILEDILGALKAIGKDPDRLTVEDLAPVDQMHLRSIEMTREMAQHAGITSDDRVLDVGCGLGGPARTIAADIGCEVVGIDLTPEFVQIGNELNRRTGLAGHVTLREGDALALPFDDDTFDVVTSMAAFMNIEDREKAYAEVARVLKPGGTFALHDVMQGSKGAPHFPILWAADPSYSFLRTPDETRRLLEGAGFEQRAWMDEDKASLAWVNRLHEAMKERGPPPVGPHLIIGPEAPVRLGNAARSMAEGRVTSATIIAGVPTQETGGGAGKAARAKKS